MIITRDYIVGVSVQFKSSGFSKPQIPEHSSFLIQEDKARQRKEIVMLLVIGWQSKHMTAAKKRKHTNTKLLTLKPKLI